MENNKRLILDTTVSDADAARTDTNNPQTINTATPAAVANLVTLDVSMGVSGGALDNIDAIAIDDVTFILPSSISMIDYRPLSISHDTRLSCSRWTADDVTGNSDRAMEMTSNLRSVDTYETIVDQFGRQQPGTHYLLKEGGNGYLTLENGSRILIL
jgi:hypothetical protein